MTISTESEENALLFKKICDKIGLTTSRQYFQESKGFWGVYVKGKFVIKKILKEGLITHSKRRKTLIEVFKRHRSNSHIKYLSEVSKGHNTTRTSSEALRCSIITARTYLAKLKKEGYLTSEINNKSPHKQLIYSLTKEGRHEIDFYERVKNDETIKTDNNCDARSCRSWKKQHTRCY